MLLDLRSAHGSCGATFSCVPSRRNVLRPVRRSAAADCIHNRCDGGDTRSI